MDSRVKERHDRSQQGFRRGAGDFSRSGDEADAGGRRALPRRSRARRQDLLSAERRIRGRARGGGRHRTGRRSSRQPASTRRSGQSRPVKSAIAHSAIESPKQVASAITYRWPASGRSITAGPATATSSGFPAPNESRRREAKNPRRQSLSPSARSKPTSAIGCASYRTRSRIRLLSRSPTTTSASRNGLSFASFTNARRWRRACWPKGSA